MYTIHLFLMSRIPCRKKDFETNGYFVQPGHRHSFGTACVLTIEQRMQNSDGGTHSNTAKAACRASTVIGVDDETDSDTHEGNSLS